MSAVEQRSDPVEEYLTTLEAALHGPDRAKARLLEEVRDGLTDAVAEHAGRGLSHERAADQALRDFGTMDDLVASCQRELTIAQARHTARSVAVTMPFLLTCWFLVRNAGDARDWALPWTAQLIAVYLAGTAVVAALLAAGALAATGTLARWLPTPDELPRLVGWTGTTASMSIAVATLALATASVLATNWPLIALACSLAAASHGAMARSVRVCRQVARLPIMEPAVSRLPE
ncbi:permease prefix domain 1-containing protein [Streptomyces sp. NPDC012510]|uniref:permease prefix domain 1-containing protein n=1 Tax=Streptomyces sp. NPDC012510 TaxID=3364838 RepID=UPI0036EA6D2E